MKLRAETLQKIAKSKDCKDRFLKKCGGIIPREETMPKRTSSTGSSRRNFLKGATVASAAALAAGPATANTTAAGAPAEQPKAQPPGPQLAAAETMPPTPDTVSQSSSGGD